MNEIEEEWEKKRLDRDGFDLFLQKVVGSGGEASEERFFYININILVIVYALNF